MSYQVNLAPSISLVTNVNFTTKVPFAMIVVFTCPVSHLAFALKYELNLSFLLVGQRQLHRQQWHGMDAV